MLTFSNCCLTFEPISFNADCCVGNDVVRDFCHDGHGQPVAVPLMAGHWVPLSCAHNYVPHVFQVRIYEGDLPIPGKPWCRPVSIVLLHFCFRLEQLSVPDDSPVLHSSIGLPGVRILFA